MNLDFLEEYVRDTFPFDEDKALKAARNKLVKIITTDKITGKPHYLTPTRKIFHCWDSATLPFIKLF